LIVYSDLFCFFLLIIVLLLSFLLRRIKLNIQSISNTRRSFFAE